MAFFIAYLHSIHCWDVFNIRGQQFALEEFKAHVDVPLMQLQEFLHLLPFNKLLVAHCGNDLLNFPDIEVSNDCNEKPF